MKNTTTVPIERPETVGPTTLFAIFVILIGATILSPSVAGGQSISMAAVGPSRVDFGSQASGTISGKRMIVLINAGSGDLQITRIVLRGDFAATNDCPGLLQAGEECRLWVSFKPSSEGVRAGQLTITDEAGTQRVVLFGTGTPALETSQQ
jgi:hypothetical protein